MVNKRILKKMEENPFYRVLGVIEHDLAGSAIISEDVEDKFIDCKIDTTEGETRVIHFCKETLKMSDKDLIDRVVALFEKKCFNPVDMSMYIETEYTDGTNVWLITPTRHYGVNPEDEEDFLSAKAFSYTKPAVAWNKLCENADKLGRRLLAHKGDLSEFITKLEKEKLIPIRKRYQE